MEIIPISVSQAGCGDMSHFMWVRMNGFIFKKELTQLSASHSLFVSDWKKKFIYLSWDQMSFAVHTGWMQQVRTLLISNGGLVWAQTHRLWIDLPLDGGLKPHTWSSAGSLSEQTALT